MFVGSRRCWFSNVDVEADPNPAADGGVGDRLLTDDCCGGGGERERDLDRERPRRPGGLGLRCR